MARTAVRPTEWRRRQTFPPSIKEKNRTNYGILQCTSLDAVRRYGCRRERSDNYALTLRH